MESNNKVKVERVTKLLRNCPLDVWEQQIVPILEAYDLQVPSTPFDIHKYVSPPKLVKGAPETLYANLLAECIKRSKANVTSNVKEEVTEITLRCPSNSTIAKVCKELSGIEVLDVK